MADPSSWGWGAQDVGKLGEVLGSEERGGIGCVGTKGMDNNSIPPSFPQHNHGGG